MVWFVRSNRFFLVNKVKFILNVMDYKAQVESNP